MSFDGPEIEENVPPPIKCVEHDLNYDLIATTFRSEEAKGFTFTSST